MSKIVEFFCPDKASRKNGMIELLRFVFCVTVVLLHSGPLFTGDFKPMRYGSYAVEFFFAVSGYLMMAHIEKAVGKPDKSLGADTIEFLWHKFKGLIPYLISVFAYGLIIHYIFLRDSLSASESYNYFVTSFGELFLLRMSGLKVQVLNGNLWYISAMLIVMFALYPIAKRLGDRFTHIIAPFTAVILIGFVNRCDAVLEKPGQWTTLGHIGTVRAAAALCLGCAAYAAAKAISKRKFKTWFRVVMTVFEWLGYGFVIANMQLAGKKSVQLMMVYLTVALVAISFSGITYSCRFLNSKFIYTLGKFSLPWYIYHYVMRYTLQYLKLDLTTGVQFAIYITGGLTLAIVSDAIINLIKKHPIKISMP